MLMLELQLPVRKQQIGDGIEKFLFPRVLTGDTALQPGRSVPIERYELQGWGLYTTGWLKTAAPVVRGS